MMTESSDVWIDIRATSSCWPQATVFSVAAGATGTSHIYLYQFDKQNPLANEAKLVRQLTHGDWEVTGISTVDEQSGSGLLHR